MAVLALHSSGQLLMPLARCFSWLHTAKCSNYIVQQEEGLVPVDVSDCWLAARMLCAFICPIIFLLGDWEWIGQFLRCLPGRRVSSFCLVSLSAMALASAGNTLFWLPYLFTSSLSLSPGSGLPQVPLTGVLPLEYLWSGYCLSPHQDVPKGSGPIFFRCLPWCSLLGMALC